MWIAALSQKNYALYNADPFSVHKAIFSRLWSDTPAMLSYSKGGLSIEKPGTLSSFSSFLSSHLTSFLLLHNRYRQTKPSIRQNTVLCRRKASKTNDEKHKINEKYWWLPKRIWYSELISVSSSNAHSTNSFFYK